MNTKILIVDDRGELRKLVTMTLAHGAYEFAEAENGQAAIDQAEKFAPDMVILDVMMPGKMNGFDVCKFLRSHPVLNQTKIVMLTARGQEQDRELGRQCGADAYIVKPFSPLALMQTVEKVLMAGSQGGEVRRHA